MNPIYQKQIEERKRLEPRNKEQKPDNKNPDYQCRECGGELKTDYKRAELVCDTCGLVVTDSFIDDSNDVRAYTQEEKEKRARTGPPVNNMTHDKSLSTNINHSDINSRDVSPESRRTFRRIKKFNVHSRTGEDRQKSLINGLKEISRISDILDIAGYIREATAKMYKELHKQDSIKGRAIESTVAAAIYLNCRKASIPKTLEEISEVSRVDRKKVGSAVRHIQAELGINIPPSEPKEHVPSIVSELELPHEVLLLATEIAEEASDNHMHVGKNPVSIAAASTYLACILKGGDCTQSEVAESAKCTDATVRNRAKEIKKVLRENESDILKEIHG